MVKDGNKETKRGVAQLLVDQAEMGSYRKPENETNGEDASAVIHLISIPIDIKNGI